MLSWVFVRKRELVIAAIKSKVDAFDRFISQKKGKYYLSSSLLYIQGDAIEAGIDARLTLI